MYIALLVFLTFVGPISTALGSDAGADNVPSAKITWPASPTGAGYTCSDDFVTAQVMEMRTANELDDADRAIIIAEDAGGRQDVCFQKTNYPGYALYKARFYTTAAIGRYSHGNSLKAATLMVAASRSLEIVNRYQMPTGFKAIYDKTVSDGQKLFKLMEQ